MDSLIICAAIIVIAGTALNFSTLTWMRDRILEIGNSLSQIAESKRLSTILTIEGKKDLDIKPEEFEPKKEELRASMHSVLEEKAESYRRKNGRIGDPDTVAFVVLNHSGFDQFVDAEVRGKARNALARLIANQDLPAAKRFLTTLARNL